MKPADELKIKQFWEKHNICEKARNMRKGAKKFYFLDGPPYASGNIHMGTAWNKILKDVFIRFWRMKGFDVWDQPGYDTHGLPIEKKVEALLKFKTKAEIEKYGIEKFNKQCKKFATEHISTMNSEFADLGVWMDWENAYLTLDNQYIESAWHTFKIAFQKGLLYKGLYPVHVCPTCETAVAYNEIEYKKMADPSIFIKFPVVGEENTFLLIWTTTPWTLLANTGVMANPNAEYVKIKFEGNEQLIIANDLVEKVFGDKPYKIVEKIKGKKLEGMKYKNPLSDFIGFSDEIEAGYRVVLSEQFVSLEDGTGLVHCAPGHGKEDYKVGVDNKLPMVCHVLLNGTFDNKCGRFSGINAREANKEIIAELDQKGYLLQEEKIVHDYPCCWRCDSQLLMISVFQWFSK
ncbi:MAG: class I tRNA ligase family protein [Candidatus Aenigmatarchaeota archaeon]